MHQFAGCLTSLACALSLMWQYLTRKWRLTSIALAYSKQAHATKRLGGLLGGAIHVRQLQMELGSPKQVTDMLAQHTSEQLKQSVWVVTFLEPHHCCSRPPSNCPSVASTSFASSASHMASSGMSGAPSVGPASVSDAGTFTTAPLPSFSRARVGLQPAQYASFIQEHCLSHGPAAHTMTLDQVRDHIRVNFPSAPIMDKRSKPLAQIMLLLQGISSNQAESDRIQMDLLQCIAGKARQRGHYVSLIIVDAEYMLARAWENLRSEYLRIMKGKWKKHLHHMIPPFDKSTCRQPPEFDQHKRYVVGWFFVASYMRDLRQFMIPVSALDAAHMKYPAQGTMYVEVTKDLLDRLHPVAQMVFLGAENVPGYTLFTREQHAAYGSSARLDPAGSDGCVIGDAAVALRAQFEPVRSATGQVSAAPREATYKACAVHQKRSMSASQVQIFDTIRKMPPSQKLKVCRHMYSNLPPHMYSHCIDPAAPTGG